MKKNPFGKTGFEVSQLGFGGMELRGDMSIGKRRLRPRPISDRDLEKLLNSILDLGINFIDTSPDYGISEKRIGRFLSSRRKEFFLATKCGCNPHVEGDHMVTDHLYTRENVERNISESLERLRTDRVDLLQFHGGSPEEIRERKLVEALKDIRDQGMIRFIGISTVLPQLEEFLSWGVFDAFQIPYSPLDPEHEEIITEVAAGGAAVIVRGGMARGAPGVEIGGTEHQSLWKAAKLDEVLPEGMSKSELILRFTLSHPGCQVAIIGTASPEHLRDNVEAAKKGPLPAELVAGIKRRVVRAVRST